MRLVSPRVRWRLLAVAATLVSALPAASAADPQDPLVPLISRMDAFFHREESEGVCLDPRHLGDLPEQIRLSVVPQLLGYCDLYRVGGRIEHREDIVHRADFLVMGRDGFRSWDASDGMLAYALLRAFESTGDARYRDAASPIVEACRALDITEARLNRGLMAALALAQHYALTGDRGALDKAREIVLLSAREQLPDGSFPHVCSGARDLHYTAWMAMELHLIARLMPEDPIAPPALARAAAFLGTRVGLDGAIRYEDLLLGRTLFYYSLPLCPEDYDTRGWTNELGYEALVFELSLDPRYHPVMRRLAALETQGAFADKWAYPPALDDPYLHWASSSRSVIRTSVVFWTLASIAAERARRGPVRHNAALSAVQGPSALANVPIRSDDSASAPPAALEPLVPNPARGPTEIAWTLDVPGRVRLQIHDAQGRRIATLLDEESPPGRRRLQWAARDRAGRPAPPGIYFVRLDLDGRQASVARLLLLR